jgi:hypothetical protein
MGRPMLAVYDSLLTMIFFTISAATLLFVLKDIMGANAVALSWTVTYVIMVNILRVWSFKVINLSMAEYLLNLKMPALAACAVICTSALFNIFIAREFSLIFKSAVHIGITGIIIFTFYRFRSESAFSFKKSNE